MPVISALNNTEPRGPTYLNMIEMAAPSVGMVSKERKEKRESWRNQFLKIYQSSYDNFLTG